MLDDAKKNQVPLKAGTNRRLFMGGAALGMASFSLVASGRFSAMAQEAGQDVPQDAPPLTDEQILNFALNLEYLEAEFYERAVFGRGLPLEDVTGQGSLGPVSGGRQVPFETDAIRKYGQAIAEDERNHVRFLRSALGSAAVARPALDLDRAFTTVARAAGLVGPQETFDPYANENNFLLAAFIFEDVGVTAYKGAAPLITNKTFLEAAAGILAVEAYHAGNLRTVLFDRGLFDPVEKISDARDSLDGPEDLDKPLRFPDGKPVIAPTDENAIAFSRTPEQVLNIVYLGGEAADFGFFPNRVNGSFNLSPVAVLPE